MVFNEKVLARARERELKMGVSYPQKNGSLYNTFKGFYVLAFIFTMGINGIYLLGTIMQKLEYSHLNMNGFINVCVLTAIMILALILSKFNSNHIVAIIFGVLNIASSTCLAIVFAQLLLNNTNNLYAVLPAKFYLIHLLPLSIIALCSFIMSIIIIRSYFKTRKSYNMVLDILFRQYNSLPVENRPDWDEYVENFEF